MDLTRGTITHMTQVVVAVRYTVFAHWKVVVGMVTYVLLIHFTSIAMLTDIVQVLAARVAGKYVATSELIVIAIIASLHVAIQLVYRHYLLMVQQVIVDIHVTRSWTIRGLPLRWIYEGLLELIIHTTSTSSVELFGEGGSAGVTGIVIE